jgi:hypothetical protein
MAIHPNIDEMIDGAAEIPQAFAPDFQSSLLTEFFHSTNGLLSGTSAAATAEKNSAANAPHKRGEGIRAALTAQAIFTAAEQAAITSKYVEEHGDRIRAQFSGIQNKSNAEADKTVRAEIKKIEEDLQDVPKGKRQEVAEGIAIEAATPEQRPHVQAALERLELAQQAKNENSMSNEALTGLTQSSPGAALAAEAMKLSVVHGTDDLSSLGFSDQKLIQLAEFKEEQSAAIHERIEKLPEQLENSQKILDDLHASKDEIKSLVADNPELRNFFNEELAELKTSIESQTAKIEFEEAAVEYVDKHGDEIKGLSAQELFSKVMAENPELIDQYKSLATASQGEIQAFATAHGIKPEELAAAYEQAQEMQEVMALTSQTISIMAQYDTRHGFIQSNLSLVDYITTADPITDEKGNMVYSDPDTNRLYHLEANEDGSIKLDENGGVTRAYYDNPLEISQLRAEAWNPDDVKFFANETTQGYDPENGFSSTLLSTLSNEDAIAAANEDASGAVGDTDLSDPENNRNLAQVEAYKSAMEGLNGASSMSFDDLELLADKFGLDGDATTRLRASMETKGVSFTDATNTPDEKPNAPELTEPQLAVAEPKDPALSTPGMNG